MARLSQLRGFWVLLCVMLILLLTTSLAAAYDQSGPPLERVETSQWSSCTVVLIGQVTDGTWPVSGALVRAYTGWWPRGLTTTDRNGYFVFAYPALPANATYEIGVQTFRGPETRYGPFGPFNCGGVSSVGILIYAGGLPATTRSIQGTVWSDWNGDTEVDRGEPRWVGWRVELYEEGWDWWPAATASTNSQGYYSFLDLVPGTYKVAIVDPARGLSYMSGWLEVSAASRTVDFDFLTKSVFVR